MASRQLAGSPATKTETTKAPWVTNRQISSRSSNLSDTSTTGATNDPLEPERAAAAKKIPPIKAPVGLAPGPDLKNCKSKVGSLNNIKHTPARSGVTIPSQKLKWNAKSKVGSLENKAHKPGGGKVKVETQKLEWKTTSKVQSLQNVNHKPGGGNVKIFNESYMDKSGEDGKQSTSPGGEATSESSSTSHRPQVDKQPSEGKTIETSLKNLKL